MTQVEAALANAARVNPQIMGHILRDIPEHTKALGDNIVIFVRLLRDMEVTVGPAQTINAIHAALCVGCTNRTYFYWALHASLISNPRDSEAFARCFDFFWRNPEEFLLPADITGADDTQNSHPPPPAANRLGEALARAQPKEQQHPLTQEMETLALAPSETAGYRDKDFATMSATEMREALHFIVEMKARMHRKPTRRLCQSNKGNITDWRRTMQRAARHGHGLDIVRTQRAQKIPPLTILCDISGSISAYSRVFLHFFHAISKTGAKINSFVFGTKLYNITKQIHERDVDIALGRVSRMVDDWSGGTKIGENLSDFHRFWARRVQGQNATTIIITDGLERGDTQALEHAMQHIYRASRYVIWMNPLMGYTQYAPLARGASIIARYVDEYHPLHNIAALKNFADILTNSPMRRS
ncbi:MAG: VWA domain-containing protein [Pseudomonadota bacterium]